MPGVVVVPGIRGFFCFKMNNCLFCLEFALVKLDFSFISLCFFCFLVVLENKIEKSYFAERLKFYFTICVFSFYLSWYKKEKKEAKQEDEMNIKKEKLAATLV